MATIQIISDLHLENDEYNAYPITRKAPYLGLLGDIGSVSDPGYFEFLNAQLQKFDVVFYVLGNHEPYDSNWDTTEAKMRRFQKGNHDKRAENPSAGLGEYVLMVRGEYNIPDSNITILGCTLFSNIHTDAMTAVSNGLNNFRHIDGWTVEEHRDMHTADLKWLNGRVLELSKDYNRRIVILTHYSPTTDERSTEPILPNRVALSSGFQTDLSREACWEERNVILWAFGHTHFNCDFVD